MKSEEKALTFIRSFLKGYSDYKEYWNYEDGCVLIGCIDLYRATGDERYRNFVLSYLDRRVTPEGEIPSYETEQFNIDSINSGRALFFALDETGEERYRKAIEYHMDRLRQHPRCANGNFMHKTIYPDQIWLDGLYMAQPFYTAYEMRFGGMLRLKDITDQFLQVRERMFSEEKKLYYHACDTAKVQPWANPETGCSANFWLRSMGWYMMALADCIGLMDEQLFEYRHALTALFREAAEGLLAYRDRESGLYYQVIDHPEEKDNYLETSGSAMIGYAMLKGVRLGVLDDEKYLDKARETVRGLVDRKLKAEADGTYHLQDICLVAGLGPGEKRDGSLAYYLSEPRVADDSKGVGPLMMAVSEMLLAGGA